MFKYDKKPCVRKENVHEKGKTKIDDHEYGDTHEIIFPEYSQEEKIEGNNGEEFEDGERIAELENREKIHKATRDSIPESSLGFTRFKRPVLPLGYEGYEASFCDRSDKEVEDNPDYECSDDLQKVRGMYPLYDESKKLIFELKYIDV